MKTETRQRIRTCRLHGKLYTELKGILFQEFHELFFLSTCIGYRNSCPVALGKTGEERFWSDTITDEEWAAYYSMILDANNMDFGSIQDEKALVGKIEEYAHGGMLHLIENVLQGYLIEKDGEYSLDRTLARDLPRRVMQYIHETATIER
jgi:hypothetical protein